MIYHHHNTHEELILNLFGFQTSFKSSVPWSRNTVVLFVLHVLSIVVPSVGFQYLTFTQPAWFYIYIYVYIYI